MKQEIDWCNSLTEVMYHRTVSCVECHDLICLGMYSGFDRNIVEEHHIVHHKYSFYGSLALLNKDKRKTQRMLNSADELAYEYIVKLNERINYIDNEINALMSKQGA